MKYNRSREEHFGVGVTDVKTEDDIGQGLTSTTVCYFFFIHFFSLSQK